MKLRIVSACLILMVAFGLTACCATGNHAGQEIESARVQVPEHPEYLALKSRSLETILEEMDQPKTRSMLASPYVIWCRSLGPICFFDLTFVMESIPVASNKGTYALRAADLVVSHIAREHGWSHEESRWTTPDGARAFQQRLAKFDVPKTITTQEHLSKLLKLLAAEYPAFHRSFRVEPLQEFLVEDANEQGFDPVFILRPKNKFERSLVCKAEHLLPSLSARMEFLKHLDSSARSKDVFAQARYLPDIWWSEVGRSRTPFAITGSAIAYYADWVRRGRSRGREAEYPSSSLSYVAEATHHPTLSIENQVLTDVWLVTMTMEVHENGGTRSYRAYSLKRRVVFDAKGERVILVVGDGEILLTVA